MGGHWLFLRRKTADYTSVESMFALRGRLKFIFCSLRRLVGQIKGKLFAYAPMNNDFSPSLHRARMHKSFLAREYSLKYSILSTLALSATRAAMHVCSKLRNVVGCRNYLFFFLRRYRVRIIFWMIYTVWRCWQHALYRMHVLRFEISPITARQKWTGDECWIASSFAMRNFDEIVQKEWNMSNTLSIFRTNSNREILAHQSPSTEIALISCM